MLLLISTLAHLSTHQPRQPAVPARLERPRQSANSVSTWPTNAEASPPGRQAQTPAVGGAQSRPGVGPSRGRSGDGRSCGGRITGDVDRSYSPVRPFGSEQHPQGSRAPHESSKRAPALPTMKLASGPRDKLGWTWQSYGPTQNTSLPPPRRQEPSSTGLGCRNTPRANLTRPLFARGPNRPLAKR